MNKHTVERLRSAYVKWKEWTPRAAQGHQFSVFAEEMSRAQLPRTARILEIGFGEGGFLDWARREGFRCVGLELDGELVDAARCRGHEAHVGEIREVFPVGEGEFDVIVLFDVLEHITLDGILDLMDDCHRLLRPGGKFIARFPNGASPFGRAYQYGDATHVSVLSGASVAQLGLAAGFELSGYHNAARGKVSRVGGLRNSWLFREAAFALRDMFQAVLSRIYFGRDVPMDPNVTVVLCKRSTRS